jgi:glycosyltransferase involved in cell wall biosynthesis
MSTIDPIASIVIPAHNEASVIARTLSTLLADARQNEFEIVVVCNGCTDSTASISETFADRGVQTLSIETPSKIAALNAGDQAVSVLPRVYLDADVRVTAESIRKLVATLDAGAFAAAPRSQLDLTNCSALVRAYFSVWSRLGHVNRGLGSGVYALSADGRARFAEFPNVMADDFFVYCLVGGDDRVSPSDAYSIVDQPRTFRDLAYRRLRIEKGNAELRRQGLSASAGGAGLADVVKKEPRLLANAALYAGLHAWARQRVSRMSVSEVGWQRAESSRVNVNDGDES